MERVEKVVDRLRLFNIFIKLKKKNSIRGIELFIKEFYGLKEDISENFFELILKQMQKDDYLSLFNVLKERNIYSLISYLKHDEKDIENLEEVITPSQYYNISKKHIDRIIEMLKELNKTGKGNSLDVLLKDEPIWLLKREPNFSEAEYRSIAYKIYLTIGLDNGVELLSKRYGEINYEKIYFLFSNLNIKDNSNEIEHQAFNNFLFNNKKDPYNIMRQILSGEFKEMFLNFDYFYNNFNFFVSKLGTKMDKNKVKLLLDERYLAKKVSTPEITGDILEDMISSYYCKYDFLKTEEQEIYRRNFEIYNNFLKGKYKSSIPMIEPKHKEQFVCEVLSLSDPRNLVLGYRSGNCFRINGEASTLFHSFLKSEHMRLLSISTLENKDFAMMLIMRNGNVLIGQGIEVSKWASPKIKGKNLYDACRVVLKDMMEYMNSKGDEIVATIIGNSNSNVSEYNNQILPFLVTPIIENSNNYYNGIFNHQCLLDISEGKSLRDIKLYTPSIRYSDKREPVLRRTKDMNFKDNDYVEIEKRLISLRFLRSQKDKKTDFYKQLLTHNELYTCCNKDWYITLFEDGIIDSFICNDDERSRIEYYSELKKIQQNILENAEKKPLILKHRKIINK